MFFLILVSFPLCKISAYVSLGGFLWIGLFTYYLGLNMESSRSSEFGMYIILTTKTTFWLYLMLRLNFLQGGSFLHCVTYWCCRAKHYSTHSFGVYYTLLHWLWVDLLFCSIRSRKYSQRARTREIVPVEGWIKELPYSTHNQRMGVLLYWCLFLEVNLADEWILSL